MNPLKHKDNLDSEDTSMRGFRQAQAVLFLTGMLLAACWSGAVRAEGTGAADPDADAARLVDEVLRKAGGDDGESLGEWTRDVIERALKRAGSKPSRQTVPGPGGAGPGLRAGGTGPGTPGRSADPLPAELPCGGKLYGRRCRTRRHGGES